MPRLCGLMETDFICEGPIFGVVSEGGDPAETNFVFLNMVFLPLGVFVAGDVGARLGKLRHGKFKVAAPPRQSES